MQKKKTLNYNLYITGFMAVGKSTVMNTLAREYRMKCLDLDKEIEKSEKMTINEIFEVYGEEYFREKETEVLQKLSRQKNIVISCGGGTPLYERNREIMKKGKVILLTAPEDVIIRRLRRRHTRPLAEGKTDEELIEMMRLRNTEYLKAADIIIETDDRSPLTTVEKIFEQLI